MDEKSLMHYGVEGMHWGIRRYQNEDGSLTALGREHYGLHKLSQINKDVHSDTANEQAVREREKMYKHISKVEESDYRQIRALANALYGKENSAKKEKYLAENFMAAAEMALAARILVDKALTVKYGDLALSSIKNDDIERGKAAVRKSERQTNRILFLIGGTIGAGALAKFIISKSAKRGGH